MHMAFDGISIHVTSVILLTAVFPPIIIIIDDESFILCYIKLFIAAPVVEGGSGLV